ncbi:MAG: alpha/beta fold hydrolase [Arcanobacterium sp.]|nr:alpha/beta fold hydrolase [Arcanobacterium sp.]
MTLLSQKQYQLPNYSIIEYRFSAPLDYTGEYTDPAAQLFNSEKNLETTLLPSEITVFVREFVGNTADAEKLPRLIYFQGGPGSAGNRAEPLGGWMEILLNKYRIVMLDQRGTGLSTPIDGEFLETFGNPVTQASFLACFRADSIVRDAEMIRKELQEDEPWTLLGQSFGGFCITTYLSLAPAGLKAGMITAGLPSTHLHADSVYELTWEKTEQRNREFFQRYPEDEETCWKIVAHLAQTPEYLPTGERLTPRRFRMLGINLGWSYGLEKLHHLLEDPFVPAAKLSDIAEEGDSSQTPSELALQTVSGERLNSRFLHAVGNELSFGANPLYWALHEAIYAQKNIESSNTGTAATAWSAHRMREKFPQFSLPDLTAGARGEQQLREDLHQQGFGFRFSGEHVFPWQGEEDPALQKFAAAVELIANSTQLPELHCQEILAKNEVPVAAWIYLPDMFVPHELSEQTASEIPNLQPLISETHHHDGLRTDAQFIVDKLLNSLTL